MILGPPPEFDPDPPKTIIFGPLSHSIEWKRRMMIHNNEMNRVGKDDRFDPRVILDRNEDDERRDDERRGKNVKNVEEKIFVNIIKESGDSADS